jgi:hypothetical protein
MRTESSGTRGIAPSSLAISDGRAAPVAATSTATTAGPAATLCSKHRSERGPRPSLNLPNPLAHQRLMRAPKPELLRLLGRWYQRTFAFGYTMVHITPHLKEGGIGGLWLVKRRVERHNIGYAAPHRRRATRVSPAIHAMHERHVRQASIIR